MSKVTLHTCILTFPQSFADEMPACEKKYKFPDGTRIDFIIDYFDDCSGNATQEHECWLDIDHECVEDFYKLDNRETDVYAPDNHNWYNVRFVIGDTESVEFTSEEVDPKNHSYTLIGV